MANQFKRKYDPEICKKIPDLFHNGASITSVCLELKITRDTYYAWRKEFEEFNEACEMGEYKSEKYMERLAMKGIRGKIRNFSAPMMIFMLKNRFRKTYGEEKKEEKSAADTLLEQIVLGKVKVVNNE